MKSKRILSFLLAAIMTISLLSSFTLTAFAATITGQCGTGATYTLTDDGVLIVSGTGAIENHAFGSAANGAALNKGFTDYQKIQKVVINEGITKIGYQAFIECSGITSVSLPSTITSIQENAFFKCTNLKSINLPEGLTYIGTNAFSHCTNLTEITLPSTLTSLGNSAFNGCTALKTVTLSEGMTAAIPQYAFWGAILTDITIPASVEKLNQYAFWAASKLKNVTIKNKDITFGDKAFSASDIVFTVPCNFDQSKITAAVVNNKSFAFSSDYLHTDADNDGVCDIEGCGTKTVASVSLHKNSVTLTSVGAAETLIATITPDDVDADLAWRSNNSAVATVSNGVVTAVGNGTATITVEAGGKTAKCTVTVDLPENPVTGVSLSQSSLKLAIGDTYELDAIIEPENADIKTATWISDKESVATVDSDGIVAGVAAGQAKITVTTLDGGKTAACVVTVLENHEHVWDPYTGTCGGCSLTHYTHGAYEWNEGKCSICGVTGGYCGYVGKETDVEYILTSTDSGNTYALTISGYGKMGEYIDYNDSSNPPWYSYREKITSVIIQNGVNDIGWGAFKYHTALKSVSIPNSVTEIKRAAFLGATSLTSISIPNSVTTIGQSVFKKSGLTSITIPYGVTKIQGATFSGCTELTSITLPNSITEIEANAFQQCSNLSQITLPTGLTTVGEYAFNQSGLSSVTISDSVTNLGMHAFSGCTKLKTVTIGGTNLTIAERAFQGDEALETLTVNNTGNVSIGNYAFMIDVAEGDDTNVDIGGGEIEGWQPEEGGSTETDPVSLSGSESTGNDTTESQTITRREDKLYSITLPANVAYTTNYATSFKNRVRSISLEKTAAVYCDSDLTLTPVFAPDTAFDKTLIWESNDKDVATVDSNGKITCVSDGEATITATTKYQLNGVYKSASCTVTVTACSYKNGICSRCGSYQQAEKNNEDCYEISNLGQLCWFADKVNNGETYINGKLMNDIDATALSYLGIGKDVSHTFAGTFDGNNKTLKIALVSTEQYVAPFPYVNGATIKNLTVSGTINTTHKFAAGIVGRIENGNANLENCLSFVEIDSTNYTGGDGTHGGLIAVADGGTTTVNNCGFAGSIIGKTTTSCGGIVGWAGATVKISNSFVAAKFELQSNSGDTFARNQKHVTVTNCYYLNALSDTIYSGATQATADKFASGEVAYLLQGTQKEQIWGQKIGTDTLPTFSETKVYEDTYNSEKIYRNEIDGNKIFSLGADKKSATVVLDNAGTYTIVFADYEDMRLANIKTFEVTVDKAQAVRVVSDKDFTLGTGDKIMLGKNLKNFIPMCDAYEVK